MAPLVLSAFVYRMDRPPPLVPNHEVRTALWVPMPALVDPARHVPYRCGPLSYSGVLVGEPDRHVVWGLTYQLLEGLFDRIGVPFKRRDGAGRAADRSR